MDDPFDVFGESDSDDDDDEKVHVAAHDEEKQRALRALANKRMAAASNEDERLLSTVDNEILDDNECDEDETRTIVTIPAWEDKKMNTTLVFMGPIQMAVCDEVGGGRGMVATRALAPGTLVLVEDPLVRWSPESVGGDPLDMLDWFLQFPSRSPADTATTATLQNMLYMIEHLHPIKTAMASDGPASMSPEIQNLLSDLETQYEDDKRILGILALLESNKLVNSDGSECTVMDVYRLLLVMQFNGLESGLYLYTAMLNHADAPNCVKFKDPSCSEVRTTRPVPKGEMLTISYVPRICSQATRRHHLWKQHRFDSMGTTPTSMELVKSVLPDSWVDRIDPESVTTRIEATTMELEGLYYALEQSKEYIESFSLEQATLELLRAADEELQNPQHVLLLPILKLHINTCDLVQHVPFLSSAARKKLLLRLVTSAIRLKPLLVQWCGPDHFDMASTELDLAQAVEELLSTSPQTLLVAASSSESVHPCDSVEQWIVLASKARRNYERIKALYPRFVGPKNK